MEIVRECFDILQNECPSIFNYFTPHVNEPPSRKNETIIIVQPKGLVDTDWEVVEESAYKQK